MGQTLLRLAAEQADVSVVAAVDRKSPAQRVIEGVPFFAASELSGVPPFDVAIDFSLPEGLSPIISLCVARKAALVSGTTGISEQQHQQLSEAATGIAVVWASNYSLGVAVLTDLVERAAQVLQGWDCDVVESHHTQKKDAPSGTALTLGEAAQSAGGQVSYASLRAGDIVGEHTVQFTTLGERIELIHRASNRDIFARGALHAASRISQRGPGLYRVRDLID
ncbi:dihydrodipicolinate reductase [Pseudoxanthomonas dokdonensis]|uniref:4-hydroxy-tetrahydrodipicolinate reductase n=2 Tax=Pseudoxanthomonas dokdonensis TaxID=344882 RepID=A0A0R0CMB7_9GAMM|nr:dihydrodipicolinate reductase [Pseudoxanthomonas dokdonensis]